MHMRRRVTLRCLVDDLDADWSDEAQHRFIISLREKVADVVAGDAKDSSLGRDLRALPGVNMLTHPLVTHFENQFAEVGDHQRENIGNLSDPHWWKQKTGRWRGAASDHSRLGDGVWLCAGDDARLAAMTTSTTSSRATSSPMAPRATSRWPRMPRYFAPSMSANRLFVTQLIEAVTAAIQVDPAEWRMALHGPEGRATSHEAALDHTHLDRARQIREAGQLEEDEETRSLTLGVNAHYSRRERLTDASVAGSPVEAICGYWFAPTADHETRDVCAECHEGHEALAT